MKYLQIPAFKFLVFVMFVLSPGGSYQELAILSNSVGGWQHNDTHILRQGNFSDSPVNRTLILPAEAFDPLGGHTIWQVTISLSWCLANTTTLNNPLTCNTINTRNLIL